MVSAKCLPRAFSSGFPGLLWVWTKVEGASIGHALWHGHSTRMAPLSSAARRCRKSIDSTSILAPLRWLSPDLTVTDEGLCLPPHCPPLGLSFLLGASWCPLGPYPGLPCPELLIKSQDHLPASPHPPPCPAPGWGLESRLRGQGSECPPQPCSCFSHLPLLLPDYQLCSQLLSFLLHTFFWKLLQPLPFPTIPIPERAFVSPTWPPAMKCPTDLVLDCHVHTTFLHHPLLPVCLIHTMHGPMGYNEPPQTRGCV